MVGPVRFTPDKDRPNNKEYSKKEKKTPIPQNSSTNSRLEFNIDNQKKFIEDRGINILWEQAYICPCLSPMTRSPKPNCPICHGRGIAYLPAEEDVVALQSQDKSVSNTDLGLYDSGTATATTKPNSEITFRDRISIPDITIRQAMLIQVTKERVEEGYRLPYDVHKITLARTTEGINLVEGKDYEIDLDTSIFKPHEKHINKNISINITTTLRYLVIDLLKEGRYQYTNKGTELEEFVNLPKKLLLRREDAWVDPIPMSIEDEYETPKDEGEWDDPKREMSGGFFGGGI